MNALITVVLMDLVFEVWNRFMLITIFIKYFIDISENKCICLLNDVRAC